MSVSGAPPILLYQYPNCRGRRPRRPIPTQMLLCNRLGTPRTSSPTNAEYNRFRRGGFYIHPILFIDDSREGEPLPYNSFFNSALCTLNSALLPPFQSPILKNLAKSFPVDKVSIPQKINISSYSSSATSSAKQTSVYRGSTTVISKCNARNGTRAFA